MKIPEIVLELSTNVYFLSETYQLFICLYIIIDVFDLRLKLLPGLLKTVAYP